MIILKYTVASLCLEILLLLLLLLLLAPIVNFDQSTYSTDEDKGSVQLVLILSNPSATDITVRVFSDDGSATGKYF